MSILKEEINDNEIIYEVESSNLKKTTYNISEKVLTIEFNKGQIYEYYDVPHRTVVQFKLAESQGKYFVQNIAKTFKYKKLNN